MSYDKQIVCLANSRKIGGRCVAGKEQTGDRSWVRPVSTHPKQEVPDLDQRYQDGSEVNIGDIVEIRLLRPVPSAWQQENHLYDDKYYWKKLGQVSWNDIGQLTDRTGSSLWSNGDSTFLGINDRVQESIAASYNYSLQLIKLPAAELHVLTPGAAFGNTKRKVRCSFIYNGIPYNLTATDPYIETNYLKNPDGTYSIDEHLYACISLAEPHEGYAYKLVATLIIHERLSGIDCSDLLL